MSRRVAELNDNFNAWAERAAKTIHNGPSAGPERAQAEATLALAYAVRLMVQTTASTSAAEGRSTPDEYADCDQVRDVKGDVWAYSEPSDTWKLRESNGMCSLTSARSWHRLVMEFGPLTPCGRREWSPER